MAQLVKDGLKCLLILDGWDEGPACLRALPDTKLPPNNSFLGNLLRSVSSNTTILITSRPDSSVDLHNRPNVKRVDILGFTKEGIHGYFREALSTQLHSTILEDECKKLKDHLANYPAIESSCYIPLNAAILIFLYLGHNRTLPTTHFEMFYELLLHFIAREVNTRQPRRTLATLSSLDALPNDLKKQLELISILAYEGVINDKVVFTQDELQTILPRGSWDQILNLLSCILPAASMPTPAQWDLPSMGVLQRVPLAGTSSKTILYNFIHLSIQEMLAAYRISQIGSNQQVRVFQTLLGEPRCAAILQFYAGFTKLTNRGVRNIITGSDFIRCSKLSLLCLIRCFFEAQIFDQSLYEKLIPRMNGKLDLHCVTLSPLDCMSIGYFLAILLKNSRELHVSVLFNDCCIDDHSISLMVGELSKNAEPCSACTLGLYVHNNKIGDIGIANISTFLQTTCTTAIKVLNLRGCRISVKGAESLARALAVNKSLQELYISGNEIGYYGTAHIATSLQTNTTLKTLWAGGRTLTSDNEVLLLAAALTANSSLVHLRLDWSSACPDTILMKIGQSVRNCMLRTLYLYVAAIHTSKRALLTEERAKEWLQYLEVGGKELLQSLEDSHVQSFHLLLHYKTKKCLQSHLLESSRQAIKETAATVNAARRQKGLGPDIDISLF